MRTMLAVIALSTLMLCAGCSDVSSDVSLGLQVVDASTTSTEAVPAAPAEVAALTVVLAKSEAAPVAVKRKASKGSSGSSKTTAAVADPLAPFRRVTMNPIKIPPVAPIVQLPPGY